MFKEIKEQIKPSYDSLEDDIVRGFYNPILKHAINYKRVSCYFSNKGLALYSEGLDIFSENDGYFQLIISNEISEKDYNIIKEGYKNKSNEERLSEEEKRKLGNLAYLISIGKADVKIGFINNGLFHSKWGFFEDKESHKIYFSGSMNETARAIENNYEAFDVDVSWDMSSNVIRRMEKRSKEFNLLWNNNYDRAQVLDITDLTYELIKSYDKGCIINKMNDDNAFVLKMKGNDFFFEDNTDRTMTTKASFISKFKAFEHSTKKFPFIKEVNYRELERLIEVARRNTEKRFIKFIVSQEVLDFINQSKYSIEEYRKSGLTLKDNDERWNKEYDAFKSIVNSQVNRPLLERQLYSSFYMYTQKRAANFSVPGAGKTAMILGVFAYLNSKEKDESIKRMLVICPKNAFKSWKDEFSIVFGDKKKLKVLTSQEKEIKNNINDFENQWLQSNLILINYESLKKFKNSLIKCLKFDSHTMLIFDEVHRVKGVNTISGTNSLQISKNIDYKYVLTGTPIPNSYLDIYNFLNILFDNEYESYFGFSQNMLKKPGFDEVQTINEKLSPYFWRINKDELGVPKAEKDILIKVAPSSEQLKLAEKIYLTTSNPLAVMIRLIQLSTNPTLINKNIDYSELGFNYNDEKDFTDNEISDSLSKQIKIAINQAVINDISEWDLQTISSPKFNRGIELVESIIMDGSAKREKIVVWALFVNTIDKIKKVLSDKGINAEVIYGKTSNDERERIIDVFKQDNNEIQVLISNPNTLGESVSLHNVAHNAVYFEYNFNLTFMLQSRDRIHRLGLKSSDRTKYYYLMTVSENEIYNFIDEKIYQRLTEKEKIMKDAIDREILVPEFDDNEIEEMKDIINQERRKY